MDPQLANRIRPSTAWNGIRTTVPCTSKSSHCWWISSHSILLPPLHHSQGDDCYRDGQQHDSSSCLRTFTRLAQADMPEEGPARSKPDVCRCRDISRALRPCTFGGQVSVVAWPPRPQGDSHVACAVQPNSSTTTFPGVKSSFSAQLYSLGGSNTSIYLCVVQTVSFVVRCVRPCPCDRYLSWVEICHMSNFARVSSPGLRFLV